MADQLYQKYGAGDTRGMGETLQAGINAQAKNFKDVIGGVNDLLGTVEKKYVEDNTMKVQDYLRNNIKQAGLGADAPEMTQISAQFGKLIDKDALGKVITDTRGKMVSNALDNAAVAGGGTFNKTEDLTEAFKAHHQSLLDQGMKPVEAAAETNKWQMSNKFMAENVAAHNELLVKDSFNKALAIVRDPNQKLNRDEALNAAVKTLPEKLQATALIQGRKTMEELSKMTSQQQAQYERANKAVVERKAAFEAEHAVKKDAAAARVQQFEVISPATKAEVAKFSGDPAGLMGKIAEDAKNGWTSLNPMRRDIAGAEVATLLQKEVNNMLKAPGMTEDDAYGIALQAYRASKANGGKAWLNDGASIDPVALKSSVEDYQLRWLNHKAAMGELNNVLAEGLKGRTALTTEGDNLLYNIKSAAESGNITGQSADLNGYLGDSTFGKVPEAPAVQQVPGAPSNKPDKAATPVAATTPISSDTIKAKAEALRKAKPIHGPTNDGPLVPDKVPTTTATGKANLKAAAKSAETAVTVPSSGGSVVEKPAKQGRIAKFMQDLGNFDTETRAAEAKLPKTIGDVSSPEKEAKFLEATAEGQSVKVKLKGGKMIIATKRNGKFEYDYGQKR